MRLLALAVTLALASGCQNAPPEAAAPAVPTAATPPASGADTAPPASEATPDTLTVVFFGDSLTEGYGLANPMAQSYPALIGEKIEAEGIPARVVNAGNSGETTAGGLRRADWVLARTTPDVFMVALGGNDQLRGLPPEETEKNLRAILTKVREAAPEAALVVAGLEALPNLGADFGTAYRAAFADAAEASGATLIPFFLEGVAGNPALNQPDGVHPTAEGQRRMAETVWEVVGPIVRARA